VHLWFALSSSYKVHYSQLVASISWRATLRISGTTTSSVQYKCGSRPKLENQRMRAFDAANLTPPSQAWLLVDFFNPTGTAGVSPFILGDTLSGTNFES
jgi:hypothetical protein